MSVLNIQPSELGYMARFQAILNQVVERVSCGIGVRVIDFGCAPRYNTSLVYTPINFLCFFLEWRITNVIT